MTEAEMSFDSSQFIQSLDSVDKKSFADDDAARIQAVNAARGLIARLETGHESAMHLVFAEPLTAACLKMGVDTGLFRALEDGRPKTASELATATGMDPAFLRRVLRCLTSMRILRQPSDNDDNDSYEAGTDMAFLLADKMFSQRIDYLFEVQLPTMMGVPKHMAKRKYVDVGNQDPPPMLDIFNTDLDFWAWTRANPEKGIAFNGFMTSISRLRRGWSSLYPLETLFSKDLNMDDSTILYVDLGGGYGKDAISLRRNLVPFTKTGRIIVQDEASVVAQAIADSDAADNVEFLAHDFFQPQPQSCMGARVYHLGSVLHDWPDHKCIEILRHIRAAMKPGYSRLLISEMMTRARGTKTYSAAMDVLMMALFSARERSEDDLRRLLGEAGLVITGIIEPPGNYERTVIQAEVQES